MTGLVGEGALAAAGLAAAVGLLAGIAAWRGGGGLAAARWAMGGHLGGVALAAACLLTGLAGNDLGIAYVAHHTERALPVGFRLSAMWAGQEGSLLVWGLVLAVVGGLVAWSRRGLSGRGEGAVLAVFLGLGLFLAAQLLSVARPFGATKFGGMEDGLGLHPMLQHWAMVLHPPLLFAGYGCAAGPFALLVGWLAAGGERGACFRGMRVWALWSWLFLTAGIVLGAWWAYVELGWGGFWAWDPVENASLMPWLAMTGLLHSLMAVRERGRLHGWAAGFAALGFLLCVAGTTLTRSGLLVSVHAFGATTVGGYLLGLLVVLGGVAGALLWRRREELGARGEGDELGSPGAGLRGAAVVALQVVLVAMLGATLVGTLFPVVGGLLGMPVAVGAPFYNEVVGTLGLVAAGLMSVGPALECGELEPGSLRRALAGPVALGLAAAVVAAVLGVREPAALACVLIAAVTAGVVARGFGRDVAAWRQVRGATAPFDPSRQGLAGGAQAAAVVLWRYHRRYGGYVAHLGLAVLLIGVSGSGLYAERGTSTLGLGESSRVGSVEVAYRGLREVRGANYSAMEAELVVTDGRGRVGRVRPQRRYYDKGMEPVSEVGLWTRLVGDVYVVLAWWSPGGTEAGFGVVVNPVASWVWIGGAALVAGGLVALLPGCPRVRTMTAAGTTASRGSPGNNPRPGGGRQLEGPADA